MSDDSKNVHSTCANPINGKGYNTTYAELTSERPHSTALRNVDQLHERVVVYVPLNLIGRSMTRTSNSRDRQTKAEIVAQREQVRMLGIALGNWREAARQCGLSEGRVLNWVVRYGWKLPKRIEAPHPREVLSPVVGVVTSS